MHLIAPLIIIVLLLACQEGKTTVDSPTEKGISEISTEKAENPIDPQTSEDNDHASVKDPSLMQIKAERKENAADISVTNTRETTSPETTKISTTLKDTFESISQVNEIPNDTLESFDDKQVELSTKSGDLTVKPPEKTNGLHDTWNNILKDFVDSEGNVNYKDLLNKKDILNNYLSDLAKKTPNDSWPRNKALAYWINAYNAFTVKLILDHYPVSSITDIHGGNPWDVKWIELDGKKYSLNQIEHDIIRPEFGDARIHFAVNCAARSCPPLLNKAFTAETLDATLERLTKNFINDPKYNSVSTENLALSRIFEWYRTDFGDLRAYIDKYTNQSISPGAEIRFLDYDWALNGK